MEQDQDCHPQLLSPSFFDLPSPFFPPLSDAELCFFAQDPSAPHVDAPLEDSFVHLLGAPSKPAPPQADLLPLAISPPPAPPLHELVLPMDEAEDEDDTAAPCAKDLDPDGVFIEDLTRQWTTVYSDAAVMGSADVVVKCKTRLEDPILSLPKKLYSSLKYEIKQHTTGTLAAAPSFLLARAVVLDAESLEEIKKDNKPALKGTIESALTKAPAKGSVGLEGSLRLQFNIVSYHLERASFVWEIRYFTPENLETPCFIKRSAPFKVYARKPKKTAEAKRAAATKPKGKGKKRALDSAEERPAKRAKTTDSSGFAEFVAKLDDLVKCNSSLPEHERRFAMELVVSKFIQLQHPAPAADSLSAQSVFLTALSSALSPPASFHPHAHT